MCDISLVVYLNVDLIYIKGDMLNVNQSKVLMSVLGSIQPGYMYLIL